MSGSELAEISESALAETLRRLERGETGEVSDETVQALLTAGVRLYARKVDEEGRDFSPVRDPAALTATDVAVTVTGAFARGGPEPVRPCHVDQPRAARPIGD